MASSSLTWHPLFQSPNSIAIRRRTSIRAFRRNDFDGFAKRVASGEAWRDAWRRANDGFEQFVYESRKTAERIDRRYAVSGRFSAVAQSAADRARELDRELELTQRWRNFSLDFSRNWPSTLLFLWFALSGWLFRILIFTTLILPFAGPLLIGAVANNLVIKGECPACKRQFAGYKNQTVRCPSCGNVVWKPQGDFFTRGGRGTTPSSKSKPDIIDVEFEEK